MRYIYALALLLTPQIALCESLDFTAGRLRFTMIPPHNVKLTADGVPVIRESHFYMVTPGWTSSLMNTDNVTPTISATVENGVKVGNVVYENNTSKAVYRYELGPDDTYKVTINYSTKGPSTQIEWDMAYLNANIIAGQPYSAVTVSGNRSGTVPIYAKSADQTASNLCPNVKSIHFDTSLGPLDVTVQGSDSSVNALRIFDARAGLQDWAQRNPIFWFGTGIYSIPKTTAGQTISATWRLGAAPVRTNILKLDTIPVLEQVRTARVPFVPEMPVIPHPKETTATPEPCRLGSSVSIVIPASPSAEEQQAAYELQAEFSTYWGISASIVSNPVAGSTAIVMGTSSAANVPNVAEGYYVSVGTNQVTVAGRDARGVYNGSQTLKQLIRADTNGVYLKGAFIRDWPSLKMRGVHWFGGPDGLAFHRKMIDLIVAPYKMNTMLYEVEFGKWTSHPEIWSTSRGMTKADMLATVDYARQHFIEPIPMINSLGHADWMFNNGQHKDLATDPTVCYQYDPENPAVYTLLFDVMQEAADLFQPKYFHIGHDEVTTGGVFPKPGSTKTATELILADVVKINDWVKARGMQTMMWGDEFLYYPTEASDAGNAPSLTVAAQRRAGLPKDIIITDWHYASSTTYPSVDVWRNGGWNIVGVPWYQWGNIQNFSNVLKSSSNALGLIQSTWAGWSMYPDIVNTSSYNQFVAYLIAAEMAWSGANPTIANLGYSPDDAFQRAWNRTALDLRTYTGFLTEHGAGNADMWDWIPGSTSTASFPTGDQEWGGVSYRVNHPVWLAGSLNPAGTWPRTVEIPLDGKKASELHFLWGTTWAGESGSQVARLQVTYSDGSTSTSYILYGQQIFAFNDTRGGIQTTTAWTGKDSSGQNATVRAWKWTNPRPGSPIAKAVVVSEITEAAPVVLGVTGVHTWVAPYTIADAARALKVYGGLTKPSSSDMNRLNLVTGVPPTASLRIDDAVAAIRRAVGLDF